MGNNPKGAKRESVTKTRHLCRNIHLPALLRSLIIDRLLRLSPQHRFLMASDLEGIVTPLAYILCNIHIWPPIVWVSYKPAQRPVPHCVCFFATPLPSPPPRSPFSTILLHILRRRAVSRTADCFSQARGHCSGAAPLPTAQETALHSPSLKIFLPQYNGMFGAACHSTERDWDSNWDQQLQRPPQGRAVEQPVGVQLVEH